MGAKGVLGTAVVKTTEEMQSTGWWATTQYPAAILPHPFIHSQLLLFKQGEAGQTIDHRE